MSDPRTALDALDAACRLCRLAIDNARDPWLDADEWSTDAEVHLAELLADRDRLRTVADLADLMADLQTALDRATNDRDDPR